MVRRVRTGSLLLALLLFVCPVHTRGQGGADSAVVAMLERDFGVTFSTDNRLVLFKNGGEKFEDLFRAVKQARHSVHLEYFNFRHDSLSRELFLLLAQKAAEGVRVRAIFDGFGNKSNSAPLRRGDVRRLRERGIEIVEYDPVRFPYINHALHRDHRKIVVIDGAVAYTGGMNVADYYVKGKEEFGEWRDVHCRVEGGVVDELQRVFVNFWNKITGEHVGGADYYNGSRNVSALFDGLKQDTCSSAGKKRVGVVNRVPEVSPAIIRRTVVSAIDAAQKQIQIINPYFTLSPSIRKALKRAVRRGVDVQIMLSAKSDIPITPRVGEHNAHRLMKAGADVFFFEGGFHHSKIMMVDSLFSFVGSANLNSRSLRYDYECNLLIADAPTTAELQRIFETDKQERCWRLTPQTWRTKVSAKHRLGAWFWQFLWPFL